MCIPATYSVAPDLSFPLIKAPPPITLIPTLLIIRVVFPNIRHKRASLFIKPLKELASHEEEIFRYKTGVSDDNDILLSYSQPVDSGLPAESQTIFVSTSSPQYRSQSRDGKPTNRYNTSSAAPPCCSAPTRSDQARPLPPPHQPHANNAASAG